MCGGDTGVTVSLAEPAAARRARGGAARRRIEQEFSLAAATSGYARLYRELV